MKALVVVIAAALLLGVAATTASAAQAAPPKEPTLFLDSFTLDPTVQYATDNFWCEFDNYGSFFSNYTGQCPYQNFTASVHWKKSAAATEYDVCLETVFQSSSPGPQCWILPAPKSGSPAALSMTFDSARMSLNDFQGTTQIWFVKACAVASSTLQQTCSVSNSVSADIPWTG
jgi:hypothetical protein